MAKKQVVMQKASIQGLIEGAASTFRDLEEQMQSWYDNMGENLQQGEKAQTIEQTASSLGSAADTLEGLDFPESLESAAEVEYRPLTKRRAARRDYNDQACYELGLAEDAIQALFDAHESSSEDDTTRDDLQELLDEIGNAKSEAECAEFPGMYG